MNTCPECGAQWVLVLGHGQTLLGFVSPHGHRHDDNCATKLYECQNGHRRKISILRRCDAEGCDWVGKTECYCHPDPKVEAWPEVKSVLSVTNLERDLLLYRELIDQGDVSK